MRKKLLKRKEVPNQTNATNILLELCKLKEHKATKGKDEYYLEEKPKVWKRAFEWMFDFKIKGGSDIEKEEWISISNPPEIGTMCLCVNTTNHNEQFVLYFDGKFDTFCTHWKSLPQAPKQD